MKRCPECYSVFPVTDEFCELDGTPLVVDSETDAIVSDGPERAIPDIPLIVMRDEGRRGEANQKTLAIVVIAGLAIGVVLFLVYYALTREPTTENSNQPSLTSSIVQPPGPLVPSRPSPVATASPSVEPSPSPSPIPSPSTQTSPQHIELSSNPIGITGDGKTKSGPVTLRLTDGSSIEADEAWQTGEGIWYRRRGIVTLLNPNQVKAIEKPAPATPQPSPSQSPKSIEHSHH